jgi:hypothetical protein
MTDKPQLKAWTSPALLVIDASSAQASNAKNGDTDSAPNTAHLFS